MPNSHILFIDKSTVLEMTHDELLIKIEKYLSKKNREELEVFEIKKGSKFLKVKF